MSVINQMLRDLDARGAPPNGTAAPTAAEPAPRPRLSRGALAGLAVLLTGAVVLNWARPDPSPETSPAPLASVRQAPAPAAVTPAPEPQPGIPPKPVAVRAAPSSPSAAPPAPLPAPPKAAASAPISPPGVAAAQPEPTVVKQMAEVSPDADAQRLHDEAQALRGAGRLDAAIDRYRQALARKPGLLAARLQLARALQESGRADDALRLLQTGYEQHGDDALAVAAGRLLADRGQAGAALEWLARGEAGLSGADHALMGALLAQLGRQQEAVHAYRRALAVDPGQGGWLLGLGLALEAQGKADEAKTAYQAALQRGSFKPEVVHFLRERTGEREP